MHTTHYTLIFIKTQNHVLLGYKKRGFGQQKWNGFGGKLEENETISEGAIRELFEESNLVVEKQHLHYMGVVTYDDDVHRRIVYIFSASQVEGDLKESDEMRPQWFEFENIPYHNMWPDSQFWLPLVLNDHHLQARFTYNDYKIYKYNVEQLDVIPDLIHVEA
ncbi:hypothetical protein PPYR_13148 [Photinus pyralis]|uniref:Oxidized purine nucleoside triphosphate hydrolase n=1 Tax=Photinus pyralis TaxID=7054 RepID=A0A1Y1LDY6_PHOPY|nr:7,8-dihydro-8-oxoguanine triphosphatase-like [Photinus pyralis]XP_031354160.1 7,8-dihydro-8-oxoguanine triphosphatase-like [Photinus pyralis]KAB0793528.1 hypothetical protein PPYR_13148 [Photinus pyralis]